MKIFALFDKTRRKAWPNARLQTTIPHKAHCNIRQRKTHKIILNNKTTTAATFSFFLFVVLVLCSCSLFLGNLTPWLSIVPFVNLSKPLNVRWEMGENWSENRARIKENSQNLGMTLHHRIRAMPLKNIPIIYNKVKTRTKWRTLSHLSPPHYSHREISCFSQQKHWDYNVKTPINNDYMPYFTLDFEENYFFTHHKRSQIQI